MTRLFVPFLRRLGVTYPQYLVLVVLWERGPSLVAEVQAALKDELAYTTVLTILRTLEGKGYVGRASEGGVQLEAAARGGRGAG